MFDHIRGGGKLALGGMSGPRRDSATSPPDGYPLTPKGTKLPLSPRVPHPIFSISALAICFQGHRKGVFWGGVSCLVCLLVDLGFGAQTANLLEERKRWGGGEAGQGRGTRVGAGEIGLICLQCPLFSYFQQLFKQKLCKSCTWKKKWVLRKDL